MSTMTNQHISKQDIKKSKSKIIPQLSSKSYFTLDFQYKFQSHCLENGCKVIPYIETPTGLKDKKPKGEAPTLLIDYKAGTNDELDKVFFKNSPLETGMLLAVQQCLEDIKSITVLKLEFCNMTAEHIETLSKILTTNVTITEVSVTGNPNKEQNFHLLLNETKLLFLSLKCCSIDGSGMEKIARELHKPFECTLLHLNLASNLLFDDGIEHVVSFLRINRTLLSLNLSDNKIYDEGCFKLIQAFQKFPLYHFEILERRQIRYTILKRNLETSNSITTVNTINTSKGSASTQDIKRSSGSHRKLSKGSVRSSKRLLKEKGSICSQATESDKKPSSIEETEPDIGKHPLVQDSYEEDIEIYCKGNEVLMNLNLSYNRITKEALCGIIQMLHYQRTVFSNERGISRICLDGNDLSNNCEQELLEFDDLINRRSRKSSITTNKTSSIRKGSSRPSVA